MARIITKELAQKIVKKLQAKRANTKNAAHDEYSVEEGGQFIAIISIRRGSNKDLGHDFIPEELHISTGQAKRLAQCPWKRTDYIRHLREQGILPAEDEDE